uniref:Uncharacterized protein n=1 Tax=Arundo donax TaxID=35708 RepID=A0A0A9BGW4_ARUDO
MLDIMIFAHKIHIFKLKFRVTLIKSLARYNYSLMYLS